jgi:hypothetical protein
MQALLFYRLILSKMNKSYFLAIYKTTGNVGLVNLNFYLYIFFGDDSFAHSVTAFCDLCQMKFN